jgi:hypothetical protein
MALAVALAVFGALHHTLEFEFPNALHPRAPAKMLHCACQSHHLRNPKDFQGETAVRRSICVACSGVLPAKAQATAWQLPRCGFWLDCLPTHEHSCTTILPADFTAAAYERPNPDRGTIGYQPANELQAVVQVYWAHVQVIAIPAGMGWEPLTNDSRSDLR